MSATFSIDRAAAGFLRHRFMRELGASCIAMIVVALLAVVGYAMVLAFRTTHPTPLPDSPVFLYLMGFAYAVSVLALVVFIPIILFVVFFPTFLITTVFGAAIESLHRRLAALIALLVSLALIAAAALAMLGASYELFGPKPYARLLQDWALVALAALTGLAAFEGAGWAWWQLTVSREEYLAARGYRPSPWELLRTLRRQLDLPPFVSFLGGRRANAVWLYLVEALMKAGLAAPFVLLTLFIAIEGDRTFLAAPEDREGLLLTVALFAGLLLLYVLRAPRTINSVAGQISARLYRDVRAWDARAPLVFLRAFDRSGGLRARSIDPIVRCPSDAGRPRTLDEILLEHASPYGPLVAVGDPRHPAPRLGAARIQPPDEGAGRQDMVAALIRASKAVVICPNDDEEAARELDLIAREGAGPRTIYLADPELPAATTQMLFARLTPEGAAPILPKRQAPIAAFVDPTRGWRVLTTSRPASVQTYVVALNMALQAVLGAAKPSRVQFRTKEDMREALTAFREGRPVTLFRDA